MSSGAGRRILESPGFTGTDDGRKAMETVHGSMRREGLVRPRDGRVLGGVCAGLGRRFGLDPWPARLLFVLILLVIPGSQILIYPILWILMPSEEVVPAPVDTTTAGAPPAYRA
jgi:phage shock protein PspC (stress-responsive transcriptional regulator)